MGRVSRRRRRFRGAPRSASGENIERSASAITGSRPFSASGLSTAGLNSPGKRKFIANREMRAIGRLHELGSPLVDQGVILPPIGDEKDEILTQHFELRGLPASLTTLDRYLERASEDLQTDDRITAASTLLHVIAELHAQDIAHRDLGPRSIWAASPTRFAVTGFMACQMPDEESLGDWTGVLDEDFVVHPEAHLARTSSGAHQR